MKSFFVNIISTSLFLLLSLSTNSVCAKIVGGTEVRREVFFIKSNHRVTYTFRCKYQVHEKSHSFHITHKKAEKGRYSYMVALLTFNGDRYCGGSLISPNYVLTAARKFHYLFYTFYRILP